MVWAWLPSSALEHLFPDAKSATKDRDFNAVAPVFLALFSLFYIAFGLIPA